ncbi:MAG: hypothetical protein IJ272_07720 [Clostridia bacterium]|nr:hypothetical protein [Clostridia bacterium]
MEDRFFFNPYGFPGGFGTNIPPNMMPPPNITTNSNNVNKMTPKEFYENQYYYYRYLNEAMDYQIKAQDFADRMSRNNSNNNGQNKSI